MLLINSSLRYILLVLSLVPLMDAIKKKDRRHEPRGHTRRDEPMLLEVAENADGHPGK